MKRADYRNANPLILSPIDTTVLCRTGFDAFANLPESIVASGGGQESAAGSFSLDGTVGQAADGNAIGGAPFAVTSGFWNFTPLAPTAASVSISGRVRTISGAGIRNAILTLTDQNGSTQISRSSSFGYYRFDEVEAGGTYLLGISTKTFTFNRSTIVITVRDEITDLEFIADPVP